MLRIIRRSCDLGGEGIFLFPDNSALSDAVRRILSDCGARLGPWTFTPKTFIEEIAKRLDIPAQIDENLQIFIVKKILAEDTEFERSFSNGSIISGVLSLILALRRAGIFSESDLFGELARNGWKVSSRHRQLAKLLDRYAEELSAMGITDRARREKAAVGSLLEKGLPDIDIPGRRVVAALFDELRQTDAKIISALAKHLDVDFFVEANISGFSEQRLREALLSSANLLERTARGLGVEVERIGDFSFRNLNPEKRISSIIAARDGELESIPKSSLCPWPCISALEAIGPIQEADLVASAIKSLSVDFSVPLSDIAIFCDEPILFARSLEEHGIPFHGIPGPAYDQSPVVRLLSLVATALEDGLSRFTLLAILKHPLLRADSAEEIDTLLCSLGIVVASDFKIPVEGLPDEKSAAATALLDFNAKFVSVFDSAFGMKLISGADFSRLVTAFFREFNIREAILERAKLEDTSSLELSIESLTAIEELLEYFRHSPKDSFGGHLAVLKSFLSQQSISEKGGRGVRFRPVSEIYRCDSRVAVVPRCVQGELPRSRNETLFLTASEASALGLDLPDALLRGYCHALSLVDRAELTLMTRPLSDGSDPLPPSPVIVSLYRALAEREGAYRESMAALAGSLLDRPFTRRRRQVAAGESLQLPRDERISFEKDLAGADFIDRAARAVRISLLFRRMADSPYGGRLDKAFEDRYKKFTAKISITQLERYLACPFAFMLEKIIEIEGRPEPMGDLSPIDLGNAFHKALEVFWKRRIDGFFGPDSTIEERIERIKSDYAAARARVIVSDSNLDDAKAQIQSCIAIGLSAVEAPIKESQMRDLEIMLMKSLNKYLEELLKKGDDFIPISTEQKLITKLGETLLSGKIDRIDADGVGRLRVIDYKSGPSAGFSDMLAMKKIQMPLYLFMARSYGEIASGRFWEGFGKCSPSIGGKFERSDCAASKNQKSVAFDEWESTLEGFGRMAQELIADISEGYFPVKPISENSCKNCSYKTICGYNPDLADSESDEE